MKFPYFSVNAFCKEPFPATRPEFAFSRNGSPRTNSEYGFAALPPETAFVFPGKKNKWSIRWFTPKSEVELCGHATMAAAHVLFEEGLVTKDSEITFSSNSGELRLVMTQSTVCAWTFLC